MSNSYMNTLLFGIYPYVCLVVLLMGSLIRFDREPYTWKSDSSQMLRAGSLRIGSNLFHYGVLVVILGHFVGFLAPHWLVAPFLSPTMHQLLAMVVGGIAGLVAIIGLSMLIWRRLGDPRIRANSRKWDIAVVVMLWFQLALGLLTVPLSAFHMDGVLFETLTTYVKGIVTLDGSVAVLMTDVPLTYKLHILLGFTIFLISPFTRMIHIWSGAGVLAYLVRPYQIVRTRKKVVKEPARS
ncbi:respiratory nitrate reductase gamma subunit [Pseudaminobacter salicylatoxidans]|uniref:nitrate reductase (quinone) n=1 Tax=Pseudaminobacter salicylatoxidans TaxID=93369 RepID=A0A316C267_PSESE|nr:respiratory nitrate reductase subunit gamma [Pseudaminobacter salicylatoxidans]PWJ83780.1 respiratory nitrate reductase gamma subunit [Pseudaminobacter salicylatoxidans]